jgi:uncharacterized membrane protein YhaH (DUF805 family)
MVGAIAAAVLIHASKGASTDVFSLTVGIALLAIAYFGFSWNGLALTAKRLHDMDMSAHHLWWIYGQWVVQAAFAKVAPVISILCVLASISVSLMLLFRRGTNGDNRFGPSPIPLRDPNADYYVPPNQRAV